MNRTPLEIIEADPSFVIGARCDGTKLELVVSHNRVMVLKTVSVAEVAALQLVLAQIQLQMLQKAELDNAAP